MNDKKFLYLHNGSRPHALNRPENIFSTAGFEVDYYWAFNNEFPDQLDGYQGVYLSGSPHGAYEDIPFIHREHELLVELATLETPMLGVCFGSQILASALCGRDQVFRRSDCEVGNKWLAVTEQGQADPLTADLGESVYMLVWHNDEVKADHPDMTILASSDLCPNQIWRYRDLPIWGIQGHPEVNKEEACAWFEADRPYFEKDGADVAQLKQTADDALAAKTMFQNFIKVCQAK